MVGSKYGVVGWDVTLYIADGGSLAPNVLNNHKEFNKNMSLHIRA
jgi:hypothetical protein